MLFNEFNLTKEDINFFIKNYRNFGIIFNLRRKDQKIETSLDRFIYEIFSNKKPTSKFDNTFFSKDYDKVLLVTNRRLLKVDLRKLNKKIDIINDKISENNVILEREKIFTSKFQKNGIFGKIKEFLSK